MSDCNKYIELISSMVDGELEAEQESELRTHIEHCDDCRKVYEAFMGISDVLSEDLVEPPEMLAKGIMFKINMQKKGSKHFTFGRFTAIAACLVLILFGASRFGFFDLNDNNEATLAAPKTANDSDSTMYAAVAPESAPAEKGFASVQDTYLPQSKQMLTGGEGVNLDRNDGTVFQLGFPTQNVAVANGTKIEDIEKEPVNLIEANEITIYDGKYYTEEKDKDKNKLLFTVSDKEELKGFSDLLISEPEEMNAYDAEDKDYLNSDPKYTILIPADTSKDENTKDKVINIWYENGEIWCVIQDINPVENELSNDDAIVDRILYKAVGLSDKLEELIKELKN